MAYAPVGPPPIDQSAVTVTVAPGAVGEATASCPGSSSATGGGGYFSEAPDASAGLLQTNPIVSSSGVSALPADGQTANGWDAAAYNNTLTPRTFNVYSVCR